MIRTSGKTAKKTVIALGYFDSVHIGHIEVIKRAKEIAKSLCARLVVFTFKGNLRAVLSGKKDREVFTYFEREKLLKQAGADKVFFAPTNSKFLSLSHTEFLRFLRSKFNVVALVSGEDYKFGFNGEGDVQKLKEYSNENGIYYEVVKTVNEDGKKVSTTSIKELLFKGEIKSANLLLNRSYFLTGKVVKDRGVGKKINCPTANIKIDENKQQLKDGVYGGKVQFKGKIYKAIINYGNRPTFDNCDRVIEAHLLDFNGNLYGKKITVFFDEFLREIEKFESIEKLEKQLKTDEEKVRNND
ncbi:MAG: riboflavin biosynthesis protein RibF [Clostridia bacterium]|nr:riboflavin biosynthesis protein RibF [Clostridia bacterium]